MSGCGRERRRVLAVAAALPLAVFVGALAIGGRPDTAAAAACTSTSEQAATAAVGTYGGQVLSVTPYDDVFVVRLLINRVVQDVVISRC